MGTLPRKGNLNLSTVVVRGTEVYLENEWSWDRNETDVNTIPRLWRTVATEIRIGCQIINGSTHEKATQISVYNITSNAITKNRKLSASERLDCWYHFTLTQPGSVICVWARRNTGLSFKFKIHIIEPSTTTATPPLTSPPTVKDKKTLSPQISALSPQSFKIGPYAIKHTGQQQVLFNPSWSLKRVALSTQISISAIKPTCSPFLSVSYAGWVAWLHARALTSPKRSRRDVTGTLETGLGVLNSMDAEALANKISSATSNLHKLERSLRSSLSALGTNQWLLSDLLPQWERINEEDHQLIVNTLGAAQINVSLALSCIQAQLWVQSTVAAIVREGEEGTLPTEIQKVIWDNVTEFEKRFQSWCCLVNFTYDRSDTEATAFVLTIRNASVYTIYPIIALGLNRSGTVLCPLEHRVWNKWQTIDVDACVAWEHQGFICDRNTIKAQGICLDTEQRGCPFEIHPNETPETVLVYVGNGRVCMRTLCDSIDNTTVDIYNHSNIGICNFTKIMGCDCNSSAPVTTHQLLQSYYTLYQELLPPPTAMNLILGRKLLQHDDLNQLLKRIRNNGQRTLTTIHHDAEERNPVLVSRME
ncbi:uncharacterized protein LOC142403694 [Mycteria americana]|uniref:uncharacterized protein LOC142403694 n=1 Tax=Mycteria americana TaxID=33587 RepID=UPI003F58D242